jgi:hypothetical protein
MPSSPPRSPQRPLHDACLAVNMEGGAVCCCSCKPTHVCCATATFRVDPPLPCALQVFDLELRHRPSHHRPHQADLWPWSPVCPATSWTYWGSTDIAVAFASFCDPTPAAVRDSSILFFLFYRVVLLGSLV